MTCARDLMLDYLIGAANRSASLFAPTATLEFPYFASIGLPTVLTGPADIAKFLGFLHETVYPDCQIEKIIIHIETPQQIFAEYHIINRSGVSGKSVKQQLFGHLTAYEGRIQRLVEAGDVIIAAEALYPHGLAAITKEKIVWKNWPPLNAVQNF